MLRFPKISVEYNIEEEDFSVPLLTVQPLVENAIRYGVRNREHGLVEITSRKTETAFEIIISDNGIGFEAEKPLPEDGTHQKEKKGGLGIFMVKKSMDDIHYEYADGKNILTIKRILHKA